MNENRCPHCRGPIAECGRKTFCQAIPLQRLSHSVGRHRCAYNDRCPKCNNRCPKCDRETEPDSYEELDEVENVRGERGGEV